MCPVCLASAAMIVGSVVSTGGATALAVKLFRGAARRHSKNSSKQ